MSPIGLTQNRARLVFEALRLRARVQGWNHLDPYLEHHLVAHAVATDTMDRVLDDEGALDHVDQLALAAAVQSTYFGASATPAAAWDILMSRHLLGAVAPWGRSRL